MRVFGLWSSDGRREDITSQELGRNILDYVVRAQGEGLTIEEIKNNLYEELARSPVPADDIKIHDDQIEVVFFEPTFEASWMFFTAAELDVVIQASIRHHMWSLAHTYEDVAGIRQTEAELREVTDLPHFIDAAKKQALLYEDTEFRPLFEHLIRQSKTPRAQAGTLLVEPDDNIPF